MVDERDVAETLDMGSITEAEVRIKTLLGSTGTVIVEWLWATDDDPATISFNAGAGTLTVVLTLAQADDLIPGVYIGEVGLLWGGVWRWAEPFPVTVLEH